MRQGPGNLKDRIRPFVMRRLKENVAKDLPPKTETVAYCEMEPAQAALYREVLDEVIAGNGRDSAGAYSGVAPAAKIEAKVTSATPIMSAAAVTAVRPGWRTVFSRAIA